jgi:hypothetical protein
MLYILRLFITSRSLLESEPFESRQAAEEEAKRIVETKGLLVLGPVWPAQNAFYLRGEAVAYVHLLELESGDDMCRPDQGCCPESEEGE